MTHDQAEALRKAARNIKTNDLPDDLRIPLHSLQADARCLFGRVAADGSVASMMADAVLERLSQIEIAALALANPSPAPAGGEGMRAETGPIQFPDDWTGAFIRGDDAGFYAGSLRAVLALLPVNDAFNYINIISPLQGLASTLESCNHNKADRPPPRLAYLAPVTPPPSPDVAGVVEMLMRGAQSIDNDATSSQAGPGADELRAVATLLESLSAEKGRLSELVQSFMEFDSEAYDRKSDRAKALIDLKKRARALSKGTEG